MTKKIVYWVLYLSIFTSSQLFAMEGLSSHQNKNNFHKIHFNIVNVDYLYSEKHSYPAVKLEYEKVHDYIKNMSLADDKINAFSLFRSLLSLATPAVKMQLLDDVLAKARHISLPDLTSVPSYQGDGVTYICNEHIIDVLVYATELYALNYNDVDSEESRELLRGFDHYMISNMNEKNIVAVPKATFNNLQGN